MGIQGASEWAKEVRRLHEFNCVCLERFSTWPIKLRSIISRTKLGSLLRLMLDTASSHVSESWREACDGLVVTAGPQARAIGIIQLAGVALSGSDSRQTEVTERAGVNESDGVSSTVQ